MIALSPVQTAWVAGLLEGEGYFMATVAQNGVLHVRVSCHMTDGDVVMRLHQLVPGSRFSGPHEQKNENHKPFYRFTINKRMIARDLLLLILPLMGSRRSERIRHILDLMEKHPPAAPWRHGTRHGYDRHKCRCDGCRRANADYAIAQRARRRERNADHAQGTAVQA